MKTICPRLLPCLGGTKSRLEGDPLTGERWRLAQEGSRDRETSWAVIRAPGRLHASGTAPPRAAPKTFYLPQLRLVLWHCRALGVLGFSPPCWAAPGPAKHHGRGWAEQMTLPLVWPGTPTTRRHLGCFPGSPHLGGSAQGYRAAVHPPCAHPEPRAAPAPADAHEHPSTCPASLCCPSQRAPALAAHPRCHCPCVGTGPSKARGTQHPPSARCCPRPRPRCTYCPGSPRGRGPHAPGRPHGAPG